MLATFRTAIAAHGIPASTLTDNGMVYTVRFATGRGGRTGFEAELRRLHIRQKNSRPNHPTTCGKVERFQQTLKKWLRAQPSQPTTTAELQTLIDRFVNDYNHRRPHRSLPQHATPATAYQARPKAGPSAHNRDTHERVLADRIDTDGKLTLRVNGRLHHIGMGRNSSKTSTSASSTPPPANYSANSPSTPPATTNPPAKIATHDGAQNKNRPNPEGSACPGSLERSQGVRGGT